ncbi:M domain protein [Clostridium sp.]|uniref:M domain protein n=1 Tax=Clostridium sp. TaxID=1506 RepID=UPI003D6CFF40
MDNETKKMFEMLMKKLDAMETRQDEIFSVVKAIEHSNTTHKAEIDNITYKVAHTEGTINKIGNVINENRAIK